MLNNTIKVSVSAGFCIDEDELNLIISGLGKKRQKQILKVSPLLYNYLCAKVETIHYEDELPNFFSIPIELDWDLTDYNYKFENK